MPDVFLSGQGDGAAGAPGAIALILAMAGAGNAAASSTATTALNLTLVAQASGAGAGPSKVALTLDLRNHPRPGHLLVGLAGGTSAATATLTQAASPLGVTAALSGRAQGHGGGQGRLAAGLSLTARANAKTVIASVRLGGLTTLAARSTAAGSNHARLLRNRLLAAQTGGQATGSGALA